MSGIELIAVGDILRCESAVNYTTIYTLNKQKMVVAKTLKEFEDMPLQIIVFSAFTIHI